MRFRRYRLLVLLALAAAVFVALPAVSNAATTGEMIVWDDTVLTEDHHGNIRIWGEGATLDCNGYSVYGDGTTHGITVAANDVTVRNCEVSGFMTGIVMFPYWEDSEPFGWNGLTLAHNISHGNSANGYAMFFAINVTATHNHGYGNGQSGIKVRSTDSSVFEFNKLIDNGDYGIYLAADSALNTLYKNKVEGNDTGIFADPDTIDNLVIANKARGNVFYGIEDTTDGLLNTYADNTCRVDGSGTSLPIGLCEK